MLRNARRTMLYVNARTMLVRSNKTRCRVREKYFLFLFHWHYYNFWTWYYIEDTAYGYIPAGYHLLPGARGYTYYLYKWLYNWWNAQARAVVLLPGGSGNNKKEGRLAQQIFRRAITLEINKWLRMAVQEATLWSNKNRRSLLSIDGIFSSKKPSQFSAFIVLEGNRYSVLFIYSIFHFYPLGICWLVRLLLVWPSW